MDIEQSESEKLESLSRRGFLTAASVSAGASLLASDALRHRQGVRAEPGPPRAKPSQRRR